MMVLATAIAGVLTAVAIVSILDPLTPSPVTGRTSIETPSPSGLVPTETPIPTPRTDDAVSRDKAIVQARDAAPDAATWDASVAEAGPLDAIFPARGEFDWSRDLPPDRWVWYVYLESREEGRGAMVFIDYIDGAVYQVHRVRG